MGRHQGWIYWSKCGEWRSSVKDGDMLFAVASRRAVSGMWCQVGRVGGYEWDGRLVSSDCRCDGRICLGKSKSK